MLSRDAGSASDPRCNGDCVEDSMAFGKIIAGGVLSVGALLSVSAQAEVHDYQVGEVPQLVVQFHDLNLNSAEGLEKAKGRVRRAVRMVCPDPNVRDLRQKEIALDCRRQANVDAETKLAALLGHDVRLASK